MLGACFDTGNLGVSALAESSIKVMLNRWPNAEIILLGSGYVPKERRLSILGKERCVRTLPIRFSKNIFLPYHFLWFTFYGLLAKALPMSWFEKILLNRNPYFRILYDTDLVGDITGGDSFSDIYGLRRFFFGFLVKLLIILLGKKLILLPQTYGPFKGRMTKRMAQYVMNQANLVYSRDRTEVEYIRDLLNNHDVDGKVRFAPDVAFILDSRKPERAELDLPLRGDTRDRLVVGFNISGLVFNGGYTRNNMFGLKADYRRLVYRVIDLLGKNENVVILLVPHVFPPAGYEVESDPEACLEVYKELNVKYPSRIFLAQGAYDHNEIKYIIGLCDFFIGSRMHACISALSQGIPTLALAYSKKFRGVFETVGLKQLVVDMRRAKTDETLAIIADAFEKREAVRKHLKTVIPEVQQKVLNIFEDIS